MQNFSGAPPEGVGNQPIIGQIIPKKLHKNKRNWTRGGGGGGVRPNHPPALYPPMTTIDKRSSVAWDCASDLHDILLFVYTKP